MHSPCPRLGDKLLSELVFSAINILSPDFEGNALGLDLVQCVLQMTLGTAKSSSVLQVLPSMHCGCFVNFSAQRSVRFRLMHWSHRAAVFDSLFTCEMMREQMTHAGRLSH